MPFVHLHTHSEYSLLDGANRIPDLLGRIQTLGMDSLALTDHGNLHGAWQFYTEAKARGVRPILGFEAYLDRKSTRLNSSHGYISYAVFCLKKKNRNQIRVRQHQIPGEAGLVTA